jgi:hypothetical protein
MGCMTKGGGLGHILWLPRFVIIEIHRGCVGYGSLIDKLDLTKEFMVYPLYVYNVKLGHESG